MAAGKVLGMGSIHSSTAIYDSTVNSGLSSEEIHVYFMVMDG